MHLHSTKILAIAWMGLMAGSLPASAGSTGDDYVYSGQKRIAIIMLAWSDRACPATRQTMVDRVWNNSNSVRHYYRDMSRNLLDFIPPADAVNGVVPASTTAVYGPYVLSIAAGFDKDVTYANADALYGGSSVEGVHPVARTLAAADGFNAANYDYLMYVSPKADNTGSVGGYAGVNGNDCHMFEVPQNYLNHEIGHNLGLLHSNTSLDVDGYGSQDCVMGNTANAHLDGPHTYQSGWYPDACVGKVSYGQYDIENLAQPDTDNLKLLRFDRFPYNPATRPNYNLWIEYRLKGVGQDVGLNGEWDKKINIHYCPPWGNRPGDDSFYSAAPNNNLAKFSVGGSYTDPDNICTVRFLRRNTTNGTATVQLIQPTGNQPPTVIAGQSFYFTPGVRAFNVATTDTEGDELTYTIVSAPSSGTLTSSGSTLTYTTGALGTYSFTVRVNDGEYDSYDQTVSLTVVGATAPVVNAGLDQTVAISTASLQGSATDDDGDVLTTNWSLVQGPASVSFTSASSPTTNAVFTVPGFYVLRLTATDGIQSTSDDVVVQYVASSGEPEISVSGNDVEIVSGDTVSTLLDGSNFGTVGAGSSAARTFSIRNYGDADLLLSGAPKVSISGSSAFVVTSQPTSPIISTASPAAVGSSPFTITFSPSSTAAQSATVTIASNDSNEPSYTFVIAGNMTTVGVTATDAIANEAGSNTGTWTITRSGSTTSSLTVYYTLGGTATRGPDYTVASSSQVVIPAGASSATVTLNPVADTVVEEPETVILNISENASYLVGSAQATITLSDRLNSAPLVDAGADQFAATQGQGFWNYYPWTGDADSGISSSNTYTALHCFGNNHTSVTVNGVTFPESFATSGPGWSVGGYQDGMDWDDDVILTGASEQLGQEFIYNGYPRTVTFTGLTVGKSYEATFYSAAWEAGTREQNFSMTGGDSRIINQDIYGDNKGIRITCTYFATSTSHTMTITPMVSGRSFHIYAMSNREVPNVAAVATLQGSASDPDTDAFTTTWSLYSGPGAVFIANPSSLTTQVYFTLPGTYVLKLSVDDGLLKRIDTVTITVARSDGSKPVISVTATDPQAAEAGLNPDPGSWTIYRSGATTSSLSVPFTMSGSAASGDYTLSSASPVTIPAGKSSVVVTLTPVNNSVAEVSETATLTLGTNAAYTIWNAASSIQILDDDVLPLQVTSPGVLTAGTVGTSYSQTLTASGGVTPYTWVLEHGDYTESAPAFEWWGLGSTPVTLTSGTSNEGYFTYTLPWAFNYYGAAVTTVHMHTNGFIDFESTEMISANTDAELALRKMVAPLFDNLDMTVGMYVTAAADNSFVSFRWDGIFSGQAARIIRMEVLLYRDGRIRFNYLGSSTGACSATVGVSAGNEEDFTLSNLNGATSMPSALSRLFTPATTMPAGLTLTAATGVISGTPTIAGTYTIKPVVSDLTLQSATKPIVLTVNDDANGAFELSAPTYVVSEAMTQLVVTVQRTGGTSGAVSVNYATSNGSAMSGSDYTSKSGTLNWAAGDNSVRTISIPILTDAVTEPDETFTVNLSTPGGGAILGLPSSATVTIYGANTVTVSASDNAAAEPNRVEGNGAFTITRTGGTYEDLAVSYAISGTASNGVDFENLNGTAVIPAGAASVVIPVKVMNDVELELNETVIMTLQAGSGFALGGTTTATVNLRDDEPCTLTVAVTDSNCTEASSGDGVFTMTRMGNASSAITVNYAMSGTAANSTDYANLSGTASIAANANTVTVTVNPTNDTICEIDETAILTIVSGTGYSIGTAASDSISIIDNDKPVISVAASDDTATEAGTTTATYTFTRSSDDRRDALTVYYTLSGTATQASDYLPLAGSVLIPAGVDTASVTLTPVNDSLNEQTETAILTITTNAAYGVAASPNNAATVMLIDNEANVVTIAVTDATGSEPERADGNATFTITRIGDTTSSLTVNYIAGGTAMNGTDYTTLSGSVTIPAGQNSTTITVEPTDDTEIETSETVSLDLMAGAGYLVGHPSTASATIRDGDAPTVTVSVGDNDAREWGTANVGTFIITRTGSLASALTVNYTMSGTAEKGTDYNALIGTVTINANTQSATVTVTPTNDTATEGTETAILTINAGTGYTVGTPNSDTLLIADNELPIITLGASDIDASEPSGNNGYFRISRAGATSAVTVNYTISGTATSGMDFTAVSGSVSFPASNNSQDVVIAVQDDDLEESPERVVLTLSANAAYSVTGATSQTLTIRDNEKMVTLAATAANASEGGDVGKYRFTKSIAAGAMTVKYVVSGTATNSTDYTTIQESITIPAGQTFADLVITPRNDFVYDPDETVIITLAENDDVYSIGTIAGQTVTISDPDGKPTVTVVASDPTAVESPQSTGFFTLYLSRQLPANQAVTYSISGTASSGADFTALTGTTTFNASVLEQRITVTPAFDGAPESPESVIMSVNPGSNYDVGTPSSATILIYDVETTFRVTYASNGSDAGSVPVDANSYNSGSSVSVLDNTGNLTRNGYTFIGWNTAANGSGTMVAPGSSFTITNDTTLYATWAMTYLSWSGGSGFSSDQNADGVANGLAWLLGVTDKNSNARNRLPTVQQSGGNLMLTFVCKKPAYRGGSSLKVQFSDDLGIADAWINHQAEVPDVSGTSNGMNFMVSPHADPTLINVQVGIPGSGAKRFARLQAQP